MSNEDVLIVGNVAIVQTQDSSSFNYPAISDQLFNKFIGDIKETVSLAIASSKAIAEDESIDCKLLYGSWIESGNEDKQLEELYESRLIPSSSFNE